MQAGVWTGSWAETQIESHSEEKAGQKSVSSGGKIIANNTYWTFSYYVVGIVLNILMNLFI